MRHPQPEPVGGPEYFSYRGTVTHSDQAWLWYFRDLAEHWESEYFRLASEQQLREKEPRNIPDISGKDHRDIEAAAQKGKRFLKEHGGEFYRDLADSVISEQECRRQEGVVALSDEIEHQLNYVPTGHEVGDLLRGLNDDAEASKDIKREDDDG